MCLDLVFRTLAVILESGLFVVAVVVTVVIVVVDDDDDDDVAGPREASDCVNHRVQCSGWWTVKSGAGTCVAVVP